MRRTAAILYEAVMLILIIASLAVLFFDDNPPAVFGWINRTIWAVFLIDVTARIVRAGRRWDHIKKNPFDIISIIPLEDIFLLARFARFIRLFRYKNLLKRYLAKLNRAAERAPFVKLTTGLAAALGITAGIIAAVTPHSLIDTVVWTARHFIQFNYRSETVTPQVGLQLAGITIKAAGLLYAGLTISRLLNVAQKIYHTYRHKKEAE